MLVSPHEAALVADAWEPGIRDPARGDRNFLRILRHFMRGVRFTGARVAELGPGHYDMAIQLRFRGAEVVPLELDPAVIALGRHRGFEPVSFDLRDGDFAATFGAGAFDGLFCNGSIDAFWHADSDERHRAYIRSLAAALKDDGWAYVAPCNSFEGLPVAEASGRPEARRLVALQRETFEALGFRTVRLTNLERNYFGVATNVRPFIVYLKNLTYRRIPR